MGQNTNGMVAIICRPDLGYKKTEVCYTHLWFTDQRNHDWTDQFFQGIYFRAKPISGMGDKRKVINDFKKLKSAGYAGSEVILQSLPDRP